MAQTDALIERLGVIETWTHSLLEQNRVLLHENARLREVLADFDPDKLELLAEWLRLQDDHREGDRIQVELYRWAGYIREAKGS